MKKIRVNLKNRSYDIIIGAGILKSIGAHLAKLNLGSDAYIITNNLIKNAHGKALAKSLEKSGFSTKFKVVPEGETSKSIIILSDVVNDLASYDKRKRIFIIAFGGGVVGDLAGFVASIYKRGISYVQVPTTLLAQVDSSIGGKTAVDLNHGKNLVGAFYQPRLVYSDVALLKTLGSRQLRSGLAEAIKYAAIKDAYLFNYLKNKHKDILSMKPQALELIVSRCSQIKARIVSRDEKETLGIRTILNFGHTLGHAIEAAKSYKGYNHGEAVALGILIASDLSSGLGLLKGAAAKKIEDLIKVVGLPVKINGITMPKIIETYHHDKKFIGARNKLVLIKGIGKTTIVENVPLKKIEEVVGKRLARC